jgi:hypothetical protein
MIRDLESGQSLYIMSLEVVSKNFSLYFSGIVASQPTKACLYLKMWKSASGLNDFITYSYTQSC